MQSAKEKLGKTLAKLILIMTHLEMICSVFECIGQLESHRYLFLHCTKKMKHVTT